MKASELNLGTFEKVENMESNKGNDIPNQFIIYYTNGKIFQSYRSPIIYKIGRDIYLTDKWDYSTTTGKYRNIFLGEDKKETERKIKAGVYTLLD